MPYLLIFVFQLRDQNYTVRFKSDDLNHQNSSHWIKKNNSKQMTFFSFSVGFCFSPLFLVVVIVKRFYCIISMLIFSFLARFNVAREEENEQWQMYFFSLSSFPYVFIPADDFCNKRQKKKSIEYSHQCSSRISTHDVDERSEVERSMFRLIDDAKKKKRNRLHYHCFYSAVWMHWQRSNTRFCEYHKIE